MWLSYAITLLLTSLKCILLIIKINCSTTKMIDQFYSNTRVSTRVNTNQHESDTSQHESTRVQHESTQSTRVQHKSNKSTRIQNKPRSQQIE